MSRNLLKVPLFFAAATLSLRSQPALAQIWARHDALVLSAKSPPLSADASRAHTFKGRQGHVVRAWDLGPSSAPVVLTWGGGPGDTFLPERLSANFPRPEAYRHIVIDQPGTGGSAWVPNWKPEDSVDDAAAFLAMRGIQGPVLVHGWSWGSTMALLFAQRHPKWVRGMAVGGVWTNTPEEVRRYLDRDGMRAWMPGLSEAFHAFSDGRGTACDLHAAMRVGAGGPELGKAYVKAEILQCQAGPIPRPTLLDPVPRSEGKPVDMATERDEDVRFAFIESEMLCRGQRGQWRLPLRFPKALAAIPLVVIQGRYDQVCTPEVAQRVFRAWPSHRKRFVPFNGGHWSFTGPRREVIDRAGLKLSPEQETQLNRASALEYGSGFIVGAAIDLLIYPSPGITAKAYINPSPAQETR